MARGFNGAWQNYQTSQGTANNTAAGLSYTDGLGRVLVADGGAGTFSNAQTIQPGVKFFRVRTAGNRIELLAYLRETPYLNFINQPYGDADRGRFISREFQTGSKIFGHFQKSPSVPRPFRR